MLNRVLPGEQTVVLPGEQGVTRRTECASGALGLSNQAIESGHESGNKFQTGFTCHQGHSGLRKSQFPGDPVTHVCQGIINFQVKSQVVGITGDAKTGTLHHQGMHYISTGVSGFPGVLPGVSPQGSLIRVLFVVTRG